MVSHKFLVFTYGCSNHPYIEKGGYSSIGRTTVCGTVSSLFDSGYPPSIVLQIGLLFNVLYMSIYFYTRLLTNIVYLLHVL